MNVHEDIHMRTCGDDASRSANGEAAMAHAAAAMAHAAAAQNRSFGGFHANGDGTHLWPPRFGEQCAGAVASNVQAPASADSSFAVEELLASQGRFADALTSLLPRLSGSEQDTVQLIGRIVAKWEEAEQARVRAFDSEKRSMTARLQATRETVQQLKEDKVRVEHERADEARRCVQAEDNVMQMRQRLAQDARDLRALREKLARAEAAEQQRRSRTASCTKEELVKRLAEFECKPLRSCDQQGLAALRKKILLKWHPDKQPSQDHAALATQVMQELQNRPEWSW